MPFKDRAEYNEYRKQWRAARPRLGPGRKPAMVQRHIGFTPAQISVLDQMAIEANLTRSALVRKLIDQAILADRT